MRLLAGYGQVKRTAGKTPAPCACETHSRGRKAVAVDAQIKAANLQRLRRIEGQVRGLQRMVAEERYCAEIMVQMSSVQEALRSVSRNLMRNHLAHCATAAIRKGPKDANLIYDELLQLIYKLSH